MPLHQVYTEKITSCIVLLHGKENGFVTATKLGTTNKLMLQPKILLQQPSVLLIELNILLL